MQRQNSSQKNVLDDPNVGRLLVKLATPAFFGMFVQTLYNVVNTIFLGHPVGALARPVVFLIPSVLVLPRLLGLKGVFMSFPSSDILTLVLTIVLLIPIIKEFCKAATEEKQLKLIPASPRRLIDFPEENQLID